MWCLQAFDTAQRELGIAPVMTGEDLVSCAVPDKLTMVAYLSQFYELFKHEPLPSSEYPNVMLSLPVLLTQARAVAFQ